MKHKYIKKYAYTLYECYSLYVNGDLDSYEPYDTLTSLGTNIVTTLSTLVARYPALVSNGSMIASVEEVLNMIFDRHMNDYCFVCDFDESEVSELVNEAKIFFRRFLAYLNLIAPRYVELLAIYATQKSKLLDQVESTTTGIARFNDTPQDEGDFANDEHTTNITQSTGTSLMDFNTPMARLKEIEESYHNVMLLWADEMDKLFIEENNI